MANSTFQYFPAIAISHSKDMIHWHVIGHAITDSEELDLRDIKDSHGIWAPDINKIGDKYVMYYSMSTWGGEWTCGIGIATADKTGRTIY